MDFMEPGYQLPEDPEVLKSWVRESVRDQIVPLEWKIGPDALQRKPEQV